MTLPRRRLGRRRRPRGRSPPGSPLSAAPREQVGLPPTRAPRSLSWKTPQTLPASPRPSRLSHILQQPLNRRLATPSVAPGSENSYISSNERTMREERLWTSTRDQNRDVLPQSPA